LGGLREESLIDVSGTEPPWRLIRVEAVTEGDHMFQIHGVAAKIAAASKGLE